MTTPDQERTLFRTWAKEQGFDWGVSGPRFCSMFEEYLIYTLARREKEMEEKVRDSERNRLYSVMRHCGVDVHAVIKLRKEWDKSAKAHALSDVLNIIKSNENV